MSFTPKIGKVVKRKGSFIGKTFFLIRLTNFKNKKVFSISLILINSNETCESTYVNKETFEVRGQTGINKLILKVFFSNLKIIN